MSWTKKQLIDQAFVKLGRSPNQFAIDPGMYEDALRTLDAMMARWAVDGIRLGYPLKDIDTSKLSDDSLLPAHAYEAVYSKLAIRVANDIGKQVSRDLKVAASEGYDTLVMRSGALDPPEMQFPDTLPVGAGNKAYRYRRDNFMPRPKDDIEIGSDSELDFY